MNPLDQLLIVIDAISNDAIASVRYLLTAIAWPKVEYGSPVSFYNVGDEPFYTTSEEGTLLKVPIPSSLQCVRRKTLVSPTIL